MPELRIQFCRAAVVATYAQPFGGSWQPLSWLAAERQALQHMPDDGTSAKQGRRVGVKRHSGDHFYLDETSFTSIPRFLEYAYV